ncbi:MAG: hypothetical protein NVV59_03475 [Chitinophagaceae bacterium]|nr:hypothetical protein [Chitinophagaceae bacterium]
MQRVHKYGLWLLIAFACCQRLCGQEGTPANDNSSLTDYSKPIQPAPDDRLFVVRNIVVEGNKRTKESIILRELFFKSGDAMLLQDLVRRFEGSRQQLMNTALFHEVVVALKSFSGYDVDVIIIVKERWYIWPVPYFKPVDRNLNQWLVEQNASLKRVNYGLKMIHNNTTGHNDKLRIWLIYGYTRQLTMSYDRPYIDKKMRWGLNMFVTAGKNREINYNTIDDKQAFLKQDDRYLRKFMGATTELYYRPKIRTKHRFGFGYSREDIADTVVALNPHYFTDQRKRVEYPEFYYGMTYYNLDYIPYPTRGHAAEIMLTKKGFSKAMNLWQLSVKASGNWPMGRKSFVSLNGFGTVKLPFSQPFYNRKLLGYSDVFMQGYEYYVIDGMAGGYIKAALGRKIFDFNVGIPGTRKLAPRRIPFNIYTRLYGNAGYIYNKYPGENFLSNRMLYSAGIGLDIVTIYDFTFKFEWSFNQLGQNGIFLHRKSIF